MTLRHITTEQHAALLRFSAIHGRTWKAKVRDLWWFVNPRDEDETLIYQLRNTLGPRWLTRVVLTDEDRGTVDVSTATAVTISMDTHPAPRLFDRDTRTYDEKQTAKLARLADHILSITTLARVARQQNGSFDPQADTLDHIAHHCAEAKRLNAELAANNVE